MTNKTKNINEYRKNYYKEHREYLIAYSKLYYLKNKKKKTNANNPKITGNTKFNKKFEPIIENLEKKDNNSEDISSGFVIVNFD